MGAYTCKRTKEPHQFQATMSRCGSWIVLSRCCLDMKKPHRSRQSTDRAAADGVHTKDSPNRRSEFRKRFELPLSLCCIQTHGRRFLLAKPPFYWAFLGVVCSIPCDLPYGLRHHV